VVYARFVAALTHCNAKQQVCRLDGTLIFVCGALHLMAGAE